VIHHTASQLPVRAAATATTGGPANCPMADHCCIQPTVVETAPASGATRTDKENSVPGMSPPTMENSSTPAYRTRATGTVPCDAQGAKAITAPAAMAANPTVSSTPGAMALWSRRPAATLPTMFTAAASAVAAPARPAAIPACA
jgi:hypothetical protein